MSLVSECIRALSKEIKCRDESVRGDIEYGLMFGNDTFSISRRDEDVEFEHFDSGLCVSYYKYLGRSENVSNWPEDEHALKDCGTKQILRIFMECINSLDE